MASWEEFLRIMNWEQGEHTTLIGPTGQGKTNLARHLLQVRENAGSAIVVMATKPTDPNLDILKERGYRVARSWPPEFDGKKVLLWPQFSGAQDVDKQKAIFQYAFASIFAAGSWTIYIDELPYVSDVLGLDRWLKVLWLQGRALDITLVVGTQRPRNVPLEAYSSSSHLFIWRTNDQEDLKRLTGLGAFDPRPIRDEVARLPRYEALYVGTRSDILAIVKAPPPE